MPVGYKQCCLEPLCHLFGVFFLNLLLKHVTINLIVNLIGLRTTHQRCTSLHVSVRTFPDTDWVRFAPNVSGTQAKQEKGERQLVWVSPLPCSLCVCRCEPAPTATALCCCHHTTWHEGLSCRLPAKQALPPWLLLPGIGLQKWKVASPEATPGVTTAFKSPGDGYPAFRSGWPYDTLLSRKQDSHLSMCLLTLVMEGPHYSNGQIHRC